jgi:PHS family inorganic phosphate transporter-like MFS transporter
MFYPELHVGHELLFDAVYIVQLSFQSLPGVTTMAVPAEIFPSAFRGAGHGISAATGKVGAMVGSYTFANMKSHGHIQGIFWVVTATSVLAMAVTIVFTPNYNGTTLEKVEELARSGQEVAAVKALYSRRLSEKASASDDCGKAEDNMSDTTVAV